MKILTILISLLLVPTASFAVDSTGNYAVWGVGKKACFGFTKAVAANDMEKYKDYIKGFLTAYNIFTEKTYSITGKMNEDQIVEWLNEYCDENPMSSVENALTSYTFDHYDKRMKSSGSGAGR
jgi:enolase